MPEQIDEAHDHGVKAWVDGIGAVVVGVLSVVQARINGQLALQVGSGTEAAVVSFGTGLLMIAIIVVLVASGRRGVARVAHSLRGAGRTADGRSVPLGRRQAGKARDFDSRIRRFESCLSFGGCSGSGAQRLSRKSRECCNTLRLERTVPPSLSNREIGSLATVQSGRSLVVQVRPLER